MGRNGNILWRADGIRIASDSTDYAQPRIAAHLPDRVRLVGAFKTVPAHVLAELHTPLECDVFVCSDSKEARGEVMELAKRIPSLRPLDAGPLGMARTLERMTILAIHLNRRYKKKGARYSVVGI